MINIIGKYLEQCLPPRSSMFFMYIVENMGMRLHLFVPDFINSTWTLGLVDTDVPFFPMLIFSYVSVWWVRRVAVSQQEVHEVTSQLANHRAVLMWTGANQTFSGLEITMIPLSHRRITMSASRRRTLWSIQAHYHQPGFPRQPVKDTPMSFQNIQGMKVKLLWKLCNL